MTLSALTRHRGERTDDRVPRRRPSATVLAGPVLVLVSELVAPRFPDGLDATGEAAFLLAHTGRFTASGLLGALAGMLLVAGFTLVGAGAHGRGRRTLRTASVLGALGGLGLVMHHTLTLTLTEVLSGGVPATALERLEEGPTAAVSILALLLGVSLAVLLLAAGVARAGRAGRAGWWLVAPAVLAVAADFSPSAWNTVGWAVLAMPVFAAAARPAPDTLIRG
ncbi:hypothetical protein [Phycicoccus jejuensis]|uniref:hypothetical protein n=1 Tax=Phycicoccus jejuensis TaxID=367299 RepID=UPI000A9CB559|nr:hypothetical protein [Phycicoccus jejuensis]